MGAVVDIEAYRKEISSDAMLSRIERIRVVMQTVILDKRSTVLDIEMVMRLDTLKDDLIDKVITYR